MYNIFSLKLVALLMWCSRTLLKKDKKVNKIEVNIKTYHINYVVSRDFNPEDHNITIVFPLGNKLCWAYKPTRIKLSKLDW